MLITYNLFHIHTNVLYYYSTLRMLKKCNILLNPYEKCNFTNIVKTRKQRTLTMTQFLSKTLHCNTKLKLI